MRRREFIGLLGGAAASPLASRAQGPNRIPRIGFLTANPEHDHEARSWVMACAQRLHELGWTDGGSIRIDYRFGAADAMPKLAQELLELQPDAIVAAGSSAAVELRQQTSTVPIIFVQVGDPIELGLVKNLAHPEGNVTGFGQFEPAIAGKWLEVLKELSPTVTRAAVILDPQNPSWKLYWKTIEASAPSFGVQLTSVLARDAAEIEHAISAFVRDSSGGLIVTNSPMTLLHREAIVALAARHEVPAVYPFRYFVAAGGLASYGIDPADPYRRAATYVDLILRGTKPADLPIQQPTKFELVINVRTAKTLRLTIPLPLLGRADEVIE